MRITRFGFVRLLALVIAGSGMQLPVCAADAGGASGSCIPPLARRDMVLGRTFDAATSGTDNTSARVPKPKIISKAEWGGGESSGTMKAHRVVRITIHHEGNAKPFDAAKDDARKMLQGLQKYGWREKGWNDVPYHFLIDTEGNIYEGRDFNYVGATNTTYDPTGHFLISCIGNFELQAPTEKELQAMIDLMAWVCDSRNIDPATIRGHMDYAETDCPGQYLYPFVVSGYFEGKVRERIAHAYGAVQPKAKPIPPASATSPGTQTLPPPKR